VRKIDTFSKPRFTFAALLFGLLGLLGLLACGPIGPAGNERDASPVEIVGFSDLDAALAAARGEGQLINFWAMWCAPCVAELPELVEVAHAYEDRGGTLVGISYDLMVAGSNPDTIVGETRDFLAARELDLAVLIFDEADFDAINERFSLPGEVPVTLAVDKHGTIVDRHVGKADKARFEEMMQKALGL